jgi:hypothetical protein
MLFFDNKYVQNAAQLLLLTLCLTGFSMNVWSQFVTFLNEETGVSATWNQVDKLQFPTLVFCPKKPFKNMGSRYVSQAEYDQNGYSINITLEGVVLNEFTNSDPYQPEVEKVTYFYGNLFCKVWV